MNMYMRPISKSEQSLTKFSNGISRLPNIIVRVKTWRLSNLSKAESNAIYVYMGNITISEAY